MLLFCGTHHVSQYIANSSTSCSTVRSVCTTYTRKSDRLNSSAPCVIVKRNGNHSDIQSAGQREDSPLIGHYQNEWETGSEPVPWRLLGSFGGTGQAKTQAKKCRATTVVAFCVAGYTQLVMRQFCLPSLEACPSKRSQAPSRYWFGPSFPHVFETANSPFVCFVFVRNEPGSYCQHQTIGLLLHWWTKK